MPSFNGFDRQGNQLWSISSDLIGTIDYMGANEFLITNANGLFEFYCDGKIVKPVKIIEQWPSSLIDGDYDATGVAINHPRFPEWDFEGMQCYIQFIKSIDGGVGIVTTREIWLYDYMSGKKVIKVLDTGTTPPTPRGLTWDGMALWVQETTANAFKKYDITTGAAFECFNRSLGYSVIDACYDGLQLYQLSASLVRQFDPTMPSATAVFSFAHGLSDPRGITFDGMNFIINSG